MKNCRNKYDERQLIERGKAFQYGFITLFGLMTLCFMISSGLELHIFDDFTAYMLCVWPAITVCFIMMIVRDAFDCINSSPGMVLFSVYGFGGLFIMAVTVVEIAQGEASVIADGVLGHALAELICGFCCALVCAVYWVHTVRRGRALKDGADD